MKSIQTFLERFNCIPFEEKPQILFQTWDTFFVIQCSQPEDSNELFQKLLKDLKELAEYDQSSNMNRPIFLNDNHPENSSEENVVSKTNQEPPQDSDIHQLIEECSVEVPEKQKQKMEDTIALDFKLLLINLINSQRLDKKEQEVKNVVEQPAECRNRAEKSLQNFRLVHKSSISFKNTSQISSIHSIAPIESTKEHEHLLSMGYKHFSITPETKSNKVTESNAENLLPIPSKCKVTLEDEIECNMPAKDVCSPVFTTFSNPLFKDNDDLNSSDDESRSDEDVPAEEFKIYSNPLCDKDEINSDKLDPHCFNVESDFVESLLNQEIRLIENLLYDNSFPRPPEELNAEIADTFIKSIPLLPIPVQDDNSQQEEIDIVTETDDVLPSKDVRFLEELLINDFILSHESFDSNFKEKKPSIPRPPPKPPDVESFFDLKPDVIAEEILDKLNEDKCFDPGREIHVSTKIEDDDYFPFMFVIRFFFHISSFLRFLRYYSSLRARTRSLILVSTIRSSDFSLG
nr:hypothetical protein [Tanacetum cinerariifolium]